MTRYFWLPLLGLALAGCPSDETDTGVSDTDTDVDSDTDTDSDTDSDADFATIVATTEVETTFSLYDDYDPVACENVTECRIPADEAKTYRVYAKSSDYLFGLKTVEISATGDYTAEWTDGQWGAYVSGTWIETEDSAYPGVEHDIEVAPDGEFVVINIAHAAGCELGVVTMTGLEFVYDDGDYSCIGYASTDMTEMFFDQTWPGHSNTTHLVRAD